MYDKAVMYEDVKRHGVKRPIVINNKYRILDGNHRAKIMEHLGYKYALVRIV
jgi:ParB-like chromosome segregation protein Spo0J